MNASVTVGIATSAMLFATFATLATLATLAAAAEEQPQQRVQVVVKKGEAYVEPDHQVDTYVMQDGNCVAELDRLLQCPIGVTVHGVKVTVTDRLSYPHVHLADNLNTLTVVRAGGPHNCRGEATVVVKLLCYYVAPDL